MPEGLKRLEDYVDMRIPGAKLAITCPDQVPEIQLYLLAADYPQESLSAEQAAKLMDNPPYWAFCWASGHVLARYILDQPELVIGKTLLDFGAGSGVVAIAAAMSGAANVIVCDNDLDALEIASLNAQLNQVNIDLCSDLSQLNIDRSRTIITIADVFYDRDNLPLLDDFNHHYEEVVVADSRLKGMPLPGLELRGVYSSHTVPDLNESSDFNSVAIYTST